MNISTIIRACRSTKNKNNQRDTPCDHSKRYIQVSALSDHECKYNSLGQSSFLLETLHQMNLGTLSTVVTKRRIKYYNIHYDFRKLEQMKSGLCYVLTY